MARFLSIAKRRLGTTLLGLGFDPRKLLSSIRFLPLFIVQIGKVFVAVKRYNTVKFAFKLVPILSDKYMESGVASGHYFHQDLWAARSIFEKQPKSHIDVASRVDGFIAHLLCFRSVKVLDIRGLHSKVDGLEFVQGDLMQPQVNRHKYDSVSCLHSLEHFGLGRYGDPIDLDGWRKGLIGLIDLLEHNGHLYVSVPIGRVQAVEMNAQRIFYPETIKIFAEQNGLICEEFSYVDDGGNIHLKTDTEKAKCDFGLGLYIFKRPQP